jgi:hypothetical protein
LDLNGASERDWLTVQEAAEMAGYTPRHVHRLASSGKVRHQQSGVGLEISQASLVHYLQTIEPIIKRRQAAQIRSGRSIYGLHEAAARRLIAAGLLRALQDAPSDDKARAWLMTEQASDLLECFLSAPPHLIRETLKNRIDSTL